MLRAVLKQVLGSFTVCIYVVCLCVLHIFLYLYCVYLCALVYMPMSYVMNIHVYSMCLCQWTSWNMTVWRVYLGLHSMCVSLSMFVCLCQWWVGLCQSNYRWTMCLSFYVTTEELKNFFVVQQCSSKLFSVSVKQIPQEAHCSELGCETDSLGCNFNYSFLGWGPGIWSLLSLPPPPLLPGIKPDLRTTMPEKRPKFFMESINVCPLCMSLLI